MAKILQENPLSNEAQSPLIAGLSEGISKLSEILDLKVGTFTDLQLSNIYISADDKNRIYEAPDGKRLWLNNPEIVVKKNGTAITQSTGHFSIDYVGGSITFESGYTLNDSDIVTVSASYIVAESKTVDDIKSLINDTNALALRYKGFYSNESSLTSALPNGVNGEFAFVLSPNFAFYAWDSAANTWKNTQSIEELSNFYTKAETDNLLNTKEPNIAAKGTSSDDDNYYWGGRKTWVDVFTKVRNVVLTGLSTTTKSAISATDTVLTALGKLQAQITELSNTKGDMSKSVYDTNLSGVVDNAEKLGGNLPEYYAKKDEAIHTYTQTDGELSGNGSNGKFKATKSGTFTAFTIGGVSYAVKAGSETEIELTSGVWYSFILDTGAKTINFKAGGGLTNTKLALATASEEDVATGKTFYAGDKELKTGTHKNRNYLFKDGVFYLKPTTKQGTLQQDNSWKMAINQMLRFGYQKTDEIVFVEFIIAGTGVYAAINTTTTNTGWTTSGNSYSSAPSYISKDNISTVFYMALRTNKYITIHTFGAGNGTTAQIKSIWTEPIE